MIKFYLSFFILFSFAQISYCQTIVDNQLISEVSEEIKPFYQNSLQVISIEQISRQTALKCFEQFDCLKQQIQPSTILEKSMLQVAYTCVSLYTPITKSENIERTGRLIFLNYNKSKNK